MGITDDSLKEVSDFLVALPASEDRERAMASLGVADTELGDTEAEMEDQASRASLYMQLLDDEGID